MEVPTTPLGSVPLLERRTELRETFYSTTYLLQKALTREQLDEEMYRARSEERVQSFRASLNTPVSPNLQRVPQPGRALEA